MLSISSLIPYLLVAPLIEFNYYKSNNPAQIASHLATKIKSTQDDNVTKSFDKTVQASLSTSTMNISNNKAEKQIFIQKMDGNINL